MEVNQQLRMMIAMVMTIELLVLMVIPYGGAVSNGECTYTDEQGRTVQIRYSEATDGEIIAETDSAHITDPKAALIICKNQDKDFKTIQDIPAGLKATVSDDEDVSNKTKEAGLSGSSSFDLCCFLSLGIALLVHLYPSTTLA